MGYNEQIARTCHEVNRAYCAHLGDHSQLPWDEAPEWQRESAKLGVWFRRMNPDAPASAQHEAWLADKERDGWTFGEVKDAEGKTHPCFVPYDKLPPEQQFKDALFTAVVNSFK